MSVRSRHRRQQSKGSVGKKIMLGLFLVLAVIAAGVGGAAFWVLDIRASADSIDTLKPASDGANSRVYDAAGNNLGFVQTDVLRSPVDMEEIPLGLQQASIAIEDENFYEHDGVDLAAIVRAARENFEAGEVRQGASTITQQLVRNLYLEDPEDTIERKIIEATMAQEYEDRYSKEKILETYLNTASYGTNDGRTAIGVEAASQVFFDKPVKNIGLKEQAMLAGLPQAPTDYNPFLNEEGAIERRNQVLDAMANEGYITEEKAAEVKQQGPGLQKGTRYTVREEQFFFDYVQDELIAKYGVQTVRQGGLKVYTSLDPVLQDAAETAILNATPITGAARALVSTDTETGEILAMASSSSYDTSQFNLAADGTRQPGSSFKPFVLTTAVDQGIDPDSTYYPAPDSIILYPENSEPFPVSGGGGGGSMSLRDATANSVNTVYAQLGLDVGPENFADMAKRLGVESDLEGVPAEALGGTSVCCTVLEMSNAYATIANGGVHHEPTAITKVEFPNGDIDEAEDPEGERVVTDGVAYTVAEVMEGTLDYGTAAGNDIPCPAAGKTGTTDLQSDAWFVGYTPDVSTAVWTGNPDARVPLPGYGADLSAPIWRDFMTVATADSCIDFPEPEDPAELSSYASSQTTSSADYDTTTTDTVTDPGAVEPITDADGDGYEDTAYAPGVDEEIPPPPAEDDGR